MKKNMGTADRTIRILLAIVIFVLYLNGTIIGSPTIIILAIIGLILLLTGLTGYCGLYIPLKISTLKSNSKI